MSLRIEHLIILAAAGCVLVLVLPRLNFVVKHAMMIVILAHVSATAIIGLVPTDLLHLGYLRVVVVLGVLALSLPRLRLDAVGVTIVTFLVYMAALVTITSEPIVSLDSYIKVFISLMMYVLAFSLVRNSSDLRRTMVGFVLGILVIVVSFFIAQIFGLGTLVYGEEGAFTGGGDVHQTVLVAYYIISLPMLFELFRDKPYFRLLAALVAVGGALVLVMIFRRGSIIAVMTGLTVWAVLTPQKKMVVRGGLITLLLAVMITPLIYDRLVVLYQERVVEGGASYADGEAGRMQDIERSLEALTTEGLAHSLIGSEAFNDREFYGTDRPIHVDYARVLVGSGIIGLGLYVLIYGQVIRMTHRRAAGNGTYRSRVARAVVCGVVVGSLFISFSSQIYVVSSLSWLFLLLGAINGWFREDRAEMEETEEEAIPAIPVGAPQLERVAE